MPLDTDVHAMATARNFAALTTLFEDGSPQTQVMWVDADDDHLLINTEVHRAKFRNIERDPRVAVLIWDADDPRRYLEVRGQAVEVVRGPEALQHIHDVSHRYSGRPYPEDRIGSERVIVRIQPGRVRRYNL